MKLPALGPIHERINALAHVTYPVYVVRGDKCSLLIDSGVNVLGPLYAAALAKTSGEARPPSHLLLTHSHWDHVGSAAYLREHIAGLRIGSHERTAAITRKPSALGLMNRLSADEAGRLRYDPPGEDLALRPFDIDVLLGQGDEFDLGGLTCRVYEVPGHTRDSLAFHFPEIGAVFPGDACGVVRGSAGTDIQPEFLASYRNYIRSVAFVGSLKPQMVCLAHNWVLTGEDATDFFKRSLAETPRYREMIEGHLRAAHGDVQRAVEAVARVGTHAGEGTGCPGAAYLTNLTLQIKHIAGLLGREG